jgi:hypothetical protein
MHRHRALDTEPAWLWPLGTVLILVAICAGLYMWSRSIDAHRESACAVIAGSTGWVQKLHRNALCVTADGRILAVLD